MIGLCFINDCLVLVSLNVLNITEKTKLKTLESVNAVSSRCLKEHHNLYFAFSQS